MKYWLLPLLLLAEIALFATVSASTFPTSPTYWQNYFADLLAQSAPILLLGFGMTLILATGGIDLSAASTVALVSCVMSSFPAGTAFWYTAVPVGLLLGLALGLINGLLISRLDVPPIIATLATMIFYRGLCFVLMGDLEKSPFVDVPGYDFFGKVTGAMALVLLLYLVGGSYFKHSRWRREVTFIGGNRIAARYAGIHLENRVTQRYVIMGFLAFLAALCFTARNSSVSASSLTGLELQVIVAVVLGGTRVQGGNASLYGTFFGVLFIAVLDEGLRSAAVWGAKNLPFKISHLEYLLLGLLLLGGVWASSKLKARTSE